VFKYDIIAPTVTLESVVDSPNFSIFYTNVSPVPFSISFSESIISFADSDVTVAGGTVTAFDNDQAPSYLTEYTHGLNISITPTSTQVGRKSTRCATRDA
jgi:hypothetical protein